ncbi:MAG: hypothetical protein HY922_04170 [Elusimicrobia bacterium]|nr:hypothetical protein [Elusimicrobiota bacterium]
MNKRIIHAVSILFILAASPALAREQFGAFKEYADRDSLKSFTQDIGGILGSACFHSGRPLGFNGFDLGLHGGFQFSAEGADKVIRGAGRRSFGVPWAQGEIGLPFRLDGFIRGISFQGLTIAGGGLRWGLPFFESDKPNTPSILLSAVAHSLVHRDFSASHQGLNVVASLNAKLLTPYVGAGLDRTRVVVRASDLDAGLVGEDAVTLAPRFTAGLTLRNILFFVKKLKYDIYLQAAYTNAHGESGIDSGLGLRF